MKAKKIIVFLTLAFTSLFYIVPIKAQVKWSVKLIQPGKYQVTIIPEDTIKSVSFKASLISSSETTLVEKTFTNTNFPELFPGFTYSKRYYCDTAITKVSGDILTCFPVFELPTGYNALIIPIKMPPCQGIIETDNKINLKDDTTDQIKIDDIIEKQRINSLVGKDLQFKYKDLEDWLKENDLNKIQVQVTIISQPTADGNHYYSAWGKSYLKLSEGYKGIYQLKTDPKVIFLYSDRTSDKQGGEKGHENQFFAKNQNDYQIVILDMSGDVIIIKSFTSNYEETFSNVARAGNIIYGINDKKMIILNLYKLR
jgi:hypothetical protein